MTRPALIAFLLYFFGGLLFGDWFPFSRFDMFADTANRREGAVPVFLIGERLVDPLSYRGFTGIDPDSLLPAGIPCSMEYRVHEAAAWMRDHTQRGSGSGEELVVAYDFVPSGERRVVARGTVWPD